MWMQLTDAVTGEPTLVNMDNVRAITSPGKETPYETPSISQANSLLMLSGGALRGVLETLDEIRDRGLIVVNVEPVRHLDAVQLVRWVAGRVLPTDVDSDRDSEKWDRAADQAVDDWHDTVARARSVVKGLTPMPYRVSIVVNDGEVQEVEGLPANSEVIIDVHAPHLDEDDPEVRALVAQGRAYLVNKGDNTNRHDVWLRTPYGE